MPTISGAQIQAKGNLIWPPYKEHIKLGLFYKERNMCDVYISL